MARLEASGSIRTGAGGVSCVSFTLPGNVPAPAGNVLEVDGHLRQ